VAQQRQALARGGSFVNCRAIRPTGVRVSPSAPHSSEECRVENAERSGTAFPDSALCTLRSAFKRAGGFEPPGCR